MPSVAKGNTIMKTKKIIITEEDINELKNILVKYRYLSAPFVDTWPLTVMSIIEQWDNPTPISES